MVNGDLSAQGARQPPAGGCCQGLGGWGWSRITRSPASRGGSHEVRCLCGGASLAQRPAFLWFLIVHLLVFFLLPIAAPVPISTCLLAGCPGLVPQLTCAKQNKSTSSTQRADNLSSAASETHPTTLLLLAACLLNPAATSPGPVVNSGTASAVWHH